MTLVEKAKLYLGMLGAVLTRTPARLNAAAAYLDAWNSHDVDAILRQSAGGSYADSLSNGPVVEQALADHAQMLLTAFPDLRFELDGAVAAGQGRVIARYVLHATNTGPLPGDIGFEQIEPTGKRFELPGVITMDWSAGTLAVSNLFDQAAFAEAIGFQANLVPQSMRTNEGDYQFGAFYRFSTGQNPNPPEAIGMTWLHVHGGEQPFQHAATVTRKTLMALKEQPGFITGMIGARRPDENGESYGFTLSAWENLDALEQGILPNPQHKEVVRAFMRDGLAYSAHSRVYQLVRAKPVMIACPACGKQNNAHKKTHVCSACGAELGTPPAYW